MTPLVFQTEFFWREEPIGVDIAADRVERSLAFTARHGIDGSKVDAVAEILKLSGEGHQTRSQQRHAAKPDSIPDVVSLAELAPASR